MRLIPEALLARLLPARYRYDPSALPAPSQPPATPVRLWVGPVNWAGQGWQWARAAERSAGVGSSALVYSLAHDFRFAADRVVPFGAYALSRRWQRAEEATVTTGFTHLLLEAERRPFGAIIDETVEAQIGRVLAAGVRVALVCHGSDIRLPSRHLAAEPDSPFAAMTPRSRSRVEAAVRRNAGVIDRLHLPTFVSTPDLLDDVPLARWLPVIVDPDRWSTDTTPLQRAVPLVAHAPSKGLVKGSDLVDPVMERLAHEGLIEYRRVSGVPAERMVDVYRDADIVLDQFRLGGYGVAACEAMAAGRIVIGHVGEGSRRTAQEASALELPIIEATGATIELVLRGVLAQRDDALAMAARGPAFVAALHDGRYSNGVLQDFLQGRSPA